MVSAARKSNAAGSGIKSGDAPARIMIPRMSTRFSIAGAAL